MTVLPLASHLTPVIVHGPECSHIAVPLDRMPISMQAFLRIRQAKVVRQDPWGWIVYFPLDDINGSYDWDALGAESVITFRSSCPHLTWKGKCELHGTLDKSLVCRLWPANEDEANFVDGCGFSSLK